MSIVQVIVVCSSPKAKTLSKPEPVQTGIKVCRQGIPVLTGFTVIGSTANCQTGYNVSLSKVNTRPAVPLLQVYH